MSGSYVFGFIFMKSECHEINILVIPFVKKKRNKQEKANTLTSLVTVFSI